MVRSGFRLFPWESARPYWSWSRPAPPIQHSYPVLLPDNPPELPDLSLIPDHICKPDYALTGLPNHIPRLPVIWTCDQIAKIRSSCQLARATLDYAGSLVTPGISTAEIDNLARDFILDQNAYPSPFNFKGFPKSISCSVNNVAAHGIPDNRQLEEGDIINVDVTVFLDGYHGDCSNTFPVGAVDKEAERLIDITNRTLDTGIAQCIDGALYRSIGESIHKVARQENLASVRILLGHGIGTFFHGPPDIYHCLNNYPGKMKAGMVFTIEPCLSAGDRRVRFLNDGWTMVTLDGSRTAQAEHTVLVTDTGAEILTQL